MSRMLLACAAVLAACSTATIEPDVCGNGVVEQFEDCDDPDNLDCDACAMRCDEMGGCSNFPGTEGFVCGPDGFCHAPSGAFEVVNQLSMPVADFTISDVDREGPHELIVQSRTTISAVFSVAEPDGAVSIPIQTPIARGPASFAQVDLDDTLDVLLPTSDGIVAYTNQFGAPTPFPFPNSLATIARPLFLRVVDDGHIGMVGADADGGLAYFILRGAAAIAETPLCGASLTAELVDAVDVFDIKPNHQLAAVKLVALDNPALSRLCVVTISPSGQGFGVLAAELSTGGDNSRPVLADLRDQVCPSLVVLQSHALMEYAPSSTQPPCGFQPVPVGLGNAPADAAPVGAVPLQPPIANRQKTALALTTGIYALNANVLDEIYRSDRPLAAVSAIDFDRDGDVDVVASSPDSPGIDLLDRRVSPSSGFLRFRFDTEAPITMFGVDDYDGDEHLDIAYVERIPVTNNPTTQGGFGLVDQLSIAYGTADQLLPGALVGSFSFVQAVISLKVTDSTDTLNVIGDLAVVFDLDGLGELSVALLHGSPQRSMLAYFDPRPTAQTSVKSELRGVVSGRFGSDRGSDVVVVEQFDGRTGISARVYRSSGVTGAEIGSQLSTNLTDVLAACDGGSDTATFMFCVDEARFLVWPADDATDLVIGIDSKLDMISFEPASFITDTTDNPSHPLSVTPWVDALEVSPRLDKTKLQVNTLKKVVMGGGAPGLIVGLTGKADTFDQTLGALDLCTFDPVAGPTCVDLGALIDQRFPSEGTEVVCVDADVARVSAAKRFEPPRSGDAELIVLCRRIILPSDQPEFVVEELYRMSFDRTQIIAVPVFSGGLSDQLQIGDLTGDGIDDLVLLERTPGSEPLFHVVRQCTSRDACGGEAQTDLGTASK